MQNPKSFAYLLLAVAAASLAASFTLFEIHRTRFMLEMYMEPGQATGAPVASPKLVNSQPANPQLDMSNWQTYPSTSLTVNWNIYRNEEYGFEFRYPPEYITQELGEYRQFDLSGPSRKFSVFVRGPKYGSAGVGVFIDHIGSYSPECPAIEYESWPGGSVSFLGGNKTKCLVTAFGEEGFPSYVVAMGNNGKWEFLYSCDDIANQFCDQILSTFRFIK